MFVQREDHYSESQMQRHSGSRRHNLGSPAQAPHPGAKCAHVNSPGRALALPKHVGLDRRMEVQQPQNMGHLGPHFATGALSTHL